MLLFRTGHGRSKKGIVITGKANEMGHDAEDGVRFDEEGVCYSTDLLDRRILFSGSHLRSPALLARLSPGESHLQGERRFQGSRTV